MVAAAKERIGVARNFGTELTIIPRRVSDEMVERLVVGALNALGDVFEVTTVGPGQETGKILRSAIVEKRACTVVRRPVKILDESVEGGEPEGLAPGFFSFPFFVFQNGGVMLWHLQL